MSISEAPAWLVRELGLAGCLLHKERYPTPCEYVVPVQGIPFWRRQERGAMRLGKWVNFGREKVTYQYDGDHPEHGSQPFEPASNFVTPDRWLVSQRLADGEGYEKVFDVVTDDGSWLPLDGSLLMLLAMRKDRWDGLEERHEAKIRKVDKDGAAMGADLMFEPYEELVYGRARHNWVNLNDAQHPQPAIPSFRVIDRRRFADHTITKEQADDARRERRLLGDHDASERASALDADLKGVAADVAAQAGDVCYLADRLQAGLER